MSQHPTISVVEPGTQAMRHYRLMEPLDRLALGDCWIEIQPGNALAVAPVHASWVGTLVQECPKGVYLRPAPLTPDDSEASRCTVCGRKAYGDWYHHRECSSAFERAGASLNRCKGILKPL